MLLFILSGRSLTKSKNKINVVWYYPNNIYTKVFKLKCQFKNVHQHITTLANNCMVSLHGEFIQVELKCKHV